MRPEGTVQGRAQVSCAWQPPGHARMWVKPAGCGRLPKCSGGLAAQRRRQGMWLHGLRPDMTAAQAVQVANNIAVVPGGCCVGGRATFVVGTGDSAAHSLTKVSLPSSGRRGLLGSRCWAAPRPALTPPWRADAEQHAVPHQRHHLPVWRDGHAGLRLSQSHEAGRLRRPHTRDGEGKPPWACRHPILVCCVDMQLIVVGLCVVQVMADIKAHGGATGGQWNEWRIGCMSICCSNCSSTLGWAASGNSTCHPVLPGVFANFCRQPACC
jgi:hypothetical protein